MMLGKLCPNRSISDWFRFMYVYVHILFNIGIVYIYIYITIYYIYIYRERGIFVYMSKTFRVSQTTCQHVLKGFKACPYEIHVLWLGDGHTLSKLHVSGSFRGLLR